MFSSEEKAYYKRHLILPGFGEAKQRLLKKAKVLVIGAGGLGCPALQYLAAAGVGSIGIVDGDVVEASNLHRQVLYSVKAIGASKAQVAKQKLQALNPYIDVAAFPEYLTKENALSFIQAYDVVVDGSDNFQTRYLINDACVMLKKPFVYGAIFTFSGQLAVFNYQEGPTYRCLYPEPPAPEDAPSCAEIGVLGVLPGLVGTYQALETIKLITKSEGVLSGQLLMIDAATQSHQKLKITANPENQQISAFSDYDAFCGVPSSSTDDAIAQSELQQAAYATAFLLDVREPFEFELDNIGGHNIPLGELKERLQELPQDRTIVTICQSGKRSQTAQKLLKKQGFYTVVNLKGGLSGN